MSSSLVNATASAEPESRRRLSAIQVGLAIGFGLPFIAGLVDLVLDYFGWSWGAHIGAPWLFGELLIITTLLAVVRYWERLPLASVGLYWPAASDFTLGLAAFLFLMVLMIATPPIYALIRHGSPDFANARGFEPLAPGVFTDLRALPVLLAIAIVVAGGISTELAMRGYGIERLQALTGSVAVGAAAAFMLDLLAHLPIWGLRYTILFAPVQLGLIALYLWRRRLAACIVANILLGISGLVILGMQAVTTLPGQHLVNGNSMLDKGQYNAAIKEYGAAIAQNPNDAYAYKMRGYTYELIGHEDRAIGDYSHAIRLDPEEGDGYRLRGFAYFDSGDLARASADADTAIRLAPKELLGYRLRAAVDEAEGDYRAAIAALDTAIRLGGGRGLYKLRGDAYSHVGDHDRALFDYSWMISLDPTNDDAHRSRAIEYALKKDYQHSYAELDQAIKLAPKDGANYATRAKINFVQQKYPQALDDFNSAVTLDPSNTMYVWERAAAYEKTGDYDHALADCNRIKSAAPRSGDGYDCIAQMDQAKGDSAGALAALEQGLRIDPNNMRLSADHAQLEIDRGHLFDADMDIKAATNEDPGSGTVHSRRAALCLETDDYDGAIKEYSKAIELNPDDAVNFEGRGSAYREKKQLDLAIADFTHSIQLAPDHESTYSNRANTYFDMNEYDKALTDLDTAIKMVPGDSYNYGLRGEVWTAKGDLKKGVADYDVAIKLDPGNRQFRERRAEIASYIR